mgnify:CR=1 FL=1
MCGIGGWFSWDEKVHPKASTIHALLKANQLRGTDSSGIAYLKEGELYFRKAPITATKLIDAVKADEWDTILHSPIGIIHARAQTKGSPKNNKNNHPVLGFGWAVVHNGTISNDDDLYRYYKDSERFAEVDTSAIPLVLSMGKTIEDQVKHLTTLGGSATIAAWEVANPRKLLIARMGHNDLYMFFDPTSKILYFSSAAVFAKSLPAYELGSLRFLTVHKLAEDRVVVLDLDNPTRTFKVTRRPFYHFGPKPKPETPAKTSSSSVGGKLKILAATLPGEENKLVALIEEEDRTYRMTWWPETAKKPVADMTRVKSSPMLLLSEEGKCRIADHPLAVLTAYGRWKFHRRLGSNYVDREFKPRRAIRKWWRVSLKEKHLVLPVEITEKEHHCDGKQPAETFIIDIKNFQGAEVQIPGYMCPWCGVTNRASGWIQNKWRCEFCKIASQPNSGGRK